MPPKPVSVTSRLSRTTRDQCRELGFAADERRGLHRQVVPSSVQGQQRRELARQLDVDQLVYVLGAGEVLEPVLTQIGTQRPAGGADQRRRSRCVEQDLAGVGDAA